MKRKQEKERYDRLSFHHWRQKHLLRLLKKFFLEKKDPVQVARETDHSPEALGKYCQQFNKVTDSALEDAEHRCGCWRV
jgi:hypothetical protein